MTIYTPDTIQDARVAIGRRYEKQTGNPAPMLSDVLAILTSPDILPLLEELIRVTKEEYNE